MWADHTAHIIWFVQDAYVRVRARSGFKRSRQTCITPLQQYMFSLCSNLLQQAVSTVELLFAYGVHTFHAVLSVQLPLEPPTSKLSTSLLMLTFHDDLLAGCFLQDVCHSVLLLLHCLIVYYLNTEQDMAWDSTGVACTEVSHHIKPVNQPCAFLLA